MSEYITRKEQYTRGSLDRTALAANPHDQFETWFEEAKRGNSKEANAMTLATASSSGAPSARMLLLKLYDERGLVFFSNYESRKASDLRENPQAALLFYWEDLERQVRIEGRVEKLSAKESDDYFDTRPRGSQLSAIASPQSRVVENRDVLETRQREVEANAEKLVRPDYWGGYRLVPERFEFWQGGLYRLHDRFVYTRRDDLWKIERLAP